MLLLLSNNISLNPHQVHQDTVQCLNVWNFLRTEVYISFAWILSLSKIEKLRLTAISTNAAVIGICESKLEASILEQQISIDNYKILCCYRNRHGGVVACYVRNDLNYNILSVLPRLTYPYLLFRRSWKYFFWNFTTYLKSHNSSNNLLPPKSNKCSKSTK